MIDDGRYKNRRKRDDRHAFGATRKIDETAKHTKKLKKDEKTGIRMKRQKIRSPERRRPPFRVLPLDWVD
jgi:hypothetical protein